MKLIDLNRDGGIGANSMFIQLGDLNILVDSGLHPKKVGRRATPDHAPLRGINLDLIIITHCHLDHIGSLPVTMREHPNAPVIMTTSSRMLVERMLHNSASVMLRQREEEHIPDYPLFTHEEIDRISRRLTGVPFGQVKRFRGARDEVEIVLHPAGHVAGAAAVEIRHKHRGIFFTGDVLFENQRTLPGAKFPAGHFDTLVIETTRGTTERTAEKTRGNEMARLVESINDTIKKGGSFLIPVFALLLKLVYLFQRRLYMEHLIAALHGHAFVFLAVLLGMPLVLLRGWLLPHAAWTATPLELLCWALLLWVPVYLLIMQKRVYRQGWLMTVVKYLFVGWCYTFLLGYALVFAALLGFTH